jgi:hypothetical protein
MTKPIPAATSVDLDLALAFYNVLVRRARAGAEPMTYQDLVNEAKTSFPDNASVQNAIPVSAGRRLDFVRAFTDQRALPDLSALVVSKATKEVGSGFNGSVEPQTARQQIAGFNWDGVSEDFEGEIALARAEVRPPKAPSVPKPMSYEKAAGLMHAYYSEHRAQLPDRVRSAREVIIRAIQQGRTAEQAFTDAVNSLAG